MQPSGNGPFSSFSWPVLILGFLPLSALVVHIVLKGMRIGQWIRVRGEVIELRPIGRDEALAPVVAFPSPHGGIHRIEDTVGHDPPRYAVGDVVKVI